MENIDCAILILLTVLIFARLNRKYAEGLSQSYPWQQKQDMADWIVRNNKLFNGRHLGLARKTMPWIDPVLYEDVRMLIKSNKLTKNNIINLI